MKISPLFVVLLVFTALSGPLDAGESDNNGPKGANPEPECEFLPVTVSL